MSLITFGQFDTNVHPDGCQVVFSDAICFGVEAEFHCVIAKVLHKNIGGRILVSVSRRFHLLVRLPQYLACAPPPAAGFLEQIFVQTVLDPDHLDLPVFGPKLIPNPVSETSGFAARTRAGSNATQQLLALGHSSRVTPALSAESGLAGGISANRLRSCSSPLAQGSRALLERGFLPGCCVLFAGLRSRGEPFRRLGMRQG